MEKNLIKTSCGIPVGKAVLLHGEPAIEVKHGRCKDTLLLKARRARHRSEAWPLQGHAAFERPPRPVRAKPAPLRTAGARMPLPPASRDKRQSKNDIKQSTTQLVRRTGLTRQLPRC